MFNKTRDEREGGRKMKLLMFLFNFILLLLLISRNIVNVTTLEFRAGVNHYFLYWLKREKKTIDSKSNKD